MSSSSTTQPHSSVSLLSDVFAGENEDTKRSLCAEVGRLADTELDSLILKLTHKLITNQGLIINSQSSSSSLSASAAPKCHLNVDELRRLLEEEKEATKMSFRGDLQRCVEPVVGSLFKRLTNKSMHFELARLDFVNGGECALVNQTESLSNSHVASLTQPPPTTSSPSGGSARLESVPLPPVCNCPNPHPHVKSIVLHREVKQEVKEENEDDAKDLMIINGTDINNQLVEAKEMKEEQDEEDKVSTGRPSSHVSIETVQYEDYTQQKNNGGDEEMCNKGGMSQKEEEEELEDSVGEFETGEMMMDIDEEEVEEDGNGTVNGTVDGNQGREEDEDTEIDDNNGEGYDDNQSDEEEDNDDDEPVRQSARNVQPDHSQVDAKRYEVTQSNLDKGQLLSNPSLDSQNASNSTNESIDDGGANLSSEQQTLTNLNEPNEVTTVTQSADLSSPSTSTGNGSNRTALNQQATVPTQHNKRKQQTSNKTGKRSKITVEEDEGEDGEDGDDSANDDPEEAKVKVLHLNCTQSNCNVKLDSFDHLNDHLSTEHQLSPLRCFATNCNARFDRSIQIGEHIKLSHSQDTRFLCTVCPKEYDSQHKAYFHWYYYHLTGQFECNFVSDCGEVTDTRKNMTTHQQAKHYSQLKHFHCTHPGCTASFSCKSQLKRHQLTHLESNQFHCNWPHCSKQCKQRGNLVMHIRTQHFGLPQSMKEQKAKNIVDLRDPNEYVRVVVDE